MEEKNISNESKKNKSIFTIIGIIIVIVIIAIVVAVVGKKGGNKAAVSSSSREDIKSKLNIDLNEPENADDLAYDIENNSIAKITYTKKMATGESMTFILRSSYAKEEDLESFGYEVNFANQPIYMTTVCEDGAEVSVEAYVALDEDENMKYMKALWMDNDKYYSMITDDLITREDFLQEVNRVIIDNHISF